jgi:hypothetical protein
VRGVVINKDYQIRGSRPLKIKYLRTNNIVDDAQL